MAAHAGRAQQLLFAFLLQLQGWQPTTSGTGPTVELWFWGYGDDREQPSSGQDGSAPLSCTVGKVLGCYNDSAWDDKPTPGRRALQHPVQLPAGVALSREACAVACCAGGYGADPARPADVPVAGVEFGADCFCDRPFTPELAHSTPAANASECAAKPCADGEPCGGANRVLVYEWTCAFTCRFRHSRRRDCHRLLHPPPLPSVGVPIGVKKTRTSTMTVPPMARSAPPPKPPPKPLVPAGVFGLMAGNGSAGSAAATGVIGGCGHAIRDNGAFSIPAGPWLRAQVAAAKAANLTWTPLVAGCTLAQLR